MEFPSEGPARDDLLTPRPPPGPSTPTPPARLRWTTRTDLRPLRGDRHLTRPPPPVGRYYHYLLPQGAPDASRQTTVTLAVTSGESGTRIRSDFSTLSYKRSSYPLTPHSSLRTQQAQRSLRGATQRKGSRDPDLSGPTLVINVKVTLPKFLSPVLMSSDLLSQSRRPRTPGNVGNPKT